MDGSDLIIAAEKPKNLQKPFQQLHCQLSLKGRIKTIKPYCALRNTPLVAATPLFPLWRTGPMNIT